MAKAALNMMTRTSAPDFVKDGIHMNAVDTGWVTDEDPAAHAARKAELGFAPPLDIIDGAARIVDPIFAGHVPVRKIADPVLHAQQLSSRPLRCCCATLIADEFLLPIALSGFTCSNHPSIGGIVAVIRDRASTSALTMRHTALSSSAL
jgi:NAD(P)-dependent dehydrogenase (short-subunit alcohol dehydrogenase family)